MYSLFDKINVHTQYAANMLLPITHNTIVDVYSKLHEITYNIPICFMFYANVY